MSLTDREKEIITNTWTTVTKDMNAAGLAIMKQFLEDNPTYQNYFSFRDVPTWEELAQDKRVQAHVANVMYYQNMMIQNIDDTVVFVKLIDKLARSHVRRRLSVEQFENLKLTHVKVLVKALGVGVMNSEAIIAWEKLYNLIIDIVKQVAESAQ